MEISKLLYGLGRFAEHGLTPVLFVTDQDMACSPQLSWYVMSTSHCVDDSMDFLHGWQQDFST